MKTLSTEVSNYQLSNLLIQSFRYCIRRRTYAAGECVEDLIQHLDIMPKQWLETILTDLEGYFVNAEHEDQCDINEWKKLKIAILRKIKN